MAQPHTPRKIGSRNGLDNQSSASAKMTHLEEKCKERNVTLTSTEFPPLNDTSNHDMIVPRGQNANNWMKNSMCTTHINFWICLGKCTITWTIWWSDNCMTISFWEIKSSVFTIRNPDWRYPLLAPPEITFKASLTHLVQINGFLQPLLPLSCKVLESVKFILYVGDTIFDLRRSWVVLCDQLFTHLDVRLQLSLMSGNLIFLALGRRYSFVITSNFIWVAY